MNYGTTYEGAQIEDVWETPEIRHKIQHYGFDITMRILTNITVAPQPAHLFVVPKGYKRISGDAAMDNIHNMMKEKIEKGHEAAKELEKVQKGEKSSSKDANDFMDAAKKVQELLNKKK